MFSTGLLLRSTLGKIEAHGLLGELEAYAWQFRQCSNIES